MRREVRRELGIEEVPEFGLLAFAEHGVYRRDETRRVEVSPSLHMLPAPSSSSRDETEETIYSQNSSYVSACAEASLSSRMWP